MTITKDDAATADKCQPNGYADEELPKVVRFWEYENGSHVRQTLRDGQELSWNWSGVDEEGWSSRDETWSYEDGVVVNTVHLSGRDCDGLYERLSRWVCPWHSLACADHGYGHRMPKWQQVSATQRDYSAEAMGY